MTKRSAHQETPAPGEGSSPVSSAGPSVRGAIDALVQASLVDLFQAYGVAVAPSPRSAFQASSELPDVCVSIGFTYDRGIRKSGRLTLSLPNGVATLMKADALG